MRILVLSPYPALSHRVWLEQLTSGLPEIDWRVMTLPARHFGWRIRSNALHWFLEQSLEAGGEPDLLLATSMTDLAAFRGLLHRRMRDVPAIVYFHENQFAYPLTPGATESVEPRMVNLYSALAADRVVFNSRYNRDSFSAGVERFLARMPDRLSGRRVRDVIEQSEVIPVPVREVFFTGTAGALPDPPRLVWNHRWEYDKGPDRLPAAVSFLVERGRDFRLCLAGQRFESTPPALKKLRRDFEPWIEDAGFLAESDYVRFLSAGGFALSTALHDFQGLAVLEAAAGGCMPVVPDRLAYPEWFGDAHRYPSCDDPDEDGRSLARRLLAMLDGEVSPAAPDLEGLRLPVLARRYRALFNSLV